MNRHVFVLAAAATLLLVGCDSPLAPRAFAPAPCRVTPVAALSTMSDSVPLANLASALSDAATRLTLGLPESDRNEMRAALARLGNRTMGDDSDTACRALLVARDVLNRQPDSPATLPDRRAMWIVIELAAATIER